MNNSILHISDLHFVGKADKSKTRFDDTYQTRFLNAVLKLTDKIKYVVITGDIADKAQEIQYRNALVFLNTVVEKLEVDKKNVVLCPGNHDVDWDILRDIVKNEDISEDKLSKIHERVEKFNNFKKFYSDFFGSSKQGFDANASVFDYIIDNDDKLIILGLNSCFRSSMQKEDQIGFINQESFEKAIKDIDLQGKYKEFGKILALHHNPKDLSTEKHHNLINWKELDKEIITYPFTVLCGHIHGQDGEAVDKNDSNTIFYLSTGSLTKDMESENTFNIYCNPQNKALDVLYYASFDKGNPEKYGWQHLSEKNAVKKPLIRPTQDKEIKKPDVLDVLLDDVNEIDRQNLDRQLSYPDSSLIKEDFNKDTNDIMFFIKERNLFKSGHFHWKNEFRSHGFIDINSLVSQSDSLELITELVYNELLSKLNKDFKETLLLAIGFECNIIGARLSVLFDCGYSFIPEPTKEGDFSEIEKKITSKNFKRIILLKDILFTADHSKELLSSINIEKKEIFVLSLFYCGKRELKDDVFSNYENVNLLSICNDIEINQCEYSGRGQLNKCPIFKNKLETIYDEC
jgi:3',5'-cyclic AMP phosphodiesterase CpdA